jgi:paired amphipathic helix protein Sin3a
LEQDDLTAEEQWSYYISSYVRVDPTEGVPLLRMRAPFLRRNLPDKDDVDSDDRRRDKPTPLSYSEKLNMRVCVNTYKILWEPYTEDWWVHSREHMFGGKEGIEEMKRATAKRSARFREKFVMNNGWMKGLSQGEVQRRKEEFEKWIKDGVMPAAEGNADEEVMADVA